MKSMIGSSVVLSCCLLLGTVFSCSKPGNETQVSGKLSEKASVRQDKASESGPPMVVQQFMGCKAHR